jgi:hypothetical protein
MKARNLHPINCSRIGTISDQQFKNWHDVTNSSTSEKVRIVRDHIYSAELA